jgi:Icc-related predicted phosphoesterase
MMDKHESDREFLKWSKADVIMTHHTPSMMSVGPKFHGDRTNMFFHNELDSFILDLEKKPALWVHGHTHESSQYRIGDTLVVCNPRGYPGENKPEYKPVFVELKEGRAEVVKNEDAE